MGDFRSQKAKNILEFLWFLAIFEGPIWGCCSQQTHQFYWLKRWIKPSSIDCANKIDGFAGRNRFKIAILEWRFLSMCYYSGGRFWRFWGPFLKAFPGSNRPDIVRNEEFQKSWLFWVKKILGSHWTIRLKNGPRNRHFSLFTIFGFLNFRSKFLAPH